MLSLLERDMVGRVLFGAVSTRVRIVETKVLYLNRGKMRRIEWANRVERRGGRQRKGKEGKRRNLNRPR